MFLHTYHPQPLIFQFGWLKIYWYGLIIALASIAALLSLIRLNKKYRKRGVIIFKSKEQIFDLFFYLVISGLVGARLFELFYSWDYFKTSPFDILKIWQGGLAIHGAIVGGLAGLIIFCYKNRLSFWKLTDLLAPAVVLGQAIGRWGNYFNQELYGRPTAVGWGIPIDLANRVIGFENFVYFHPVFLYESLGSLIILGILLWMRKKSIKSKIYKVGRQGAVFLIYLSLYSVLRFFIEFLRIDPQPIWLGLRLGQWLSLGVVAASLAVFMIIILSTLGAIDKK